MVRGASVRGADSSEPEPAKRDRSGAILAGVPLLLLLLPLLLHTSPHGVFAGYSGAYLALLIGASAGACATVWAVAVRCSRARSRRPAVAFVTVLGAFMGSLGFAEWALRASPLDDTFRNLALFGHERSLLLGFEQRADHEWQQGGAGLATDERRFRKRANEPVMPGDPRTTIAVVGGSSAFGFGLADQEAWPSRLEARLQQG